MILNIFDMPATVKIEQVVSSLLYDTLNFLFHIPCRDTRYNLIYITYQYFSEITLCHAKRLAQANLGYSRNRLCLQLIRVLYGLFSALLS